MKTSKYENLKSLGKRKTKEREKSNLLGSISLKGTIKNDDTRHKGKRVEDQLIKSKISLNKVLSKTQEDRISSEKLIYVKKQKKSNYISTFKIKFSFDYFFSSLMLFKLGHLSFGGALPGNNSFFSSLLYFLYFKRQRKISN